jgi:hypothetical protein
MEMGRSCQAPAAIRVVHGSRARWLTICQPPTTVVVGPETPSRTVGAANAESKLSFESQHTNDNLTFAPRGPLRFPTGGLGGGQRGTP